MQRCPNSAPLYSLRAAGRENPSGFYSRADAHSTQLPHRHSEAAWADAQASQLVQRRQLRWNAARQAYAIEVAAHQWRLSGAAHHGVVERWNTKALRYLAQRCDGPHSGPNTYREYPHMVHAY